MLNLLMPFLFKIIEKLSRFFFLIRMDIYFLFYFPLKVILSLHHTLQSNPRSS